MTSFALILWAYTQNGSAMTVSLMSFFNYMPYIIVGLFAGTFVDNHSKKKVMLVSDSIAAVCSAIVFALRIGIYGGKRHEENSIWYFLDFVWIQHGLYFRTGIVGNYAGNIHVVCIRWTGFFDFWIY